MTRVTGRSPRHKCPRCGTRRVLIAYASTHAHPHLAYVACRVCLKELGHLTVRGDTGRNQSKEAQP